MDGGLDEVEMTDVGEVKRRLAEMERVAGILEARLVLYQNALESIRATVGTVLDG
jgi:hypothetical protein